MRKCIHSSVSTHWKHLVSPSSERMQLLLSISCLAAISVSLRISRKICDVTSKNNSVIFDCNGRKLSSVPTDISWNVTELDLSDNRIRKISKAPFSKLINLTFLNLKTNKLTGSQAIEKQTFSDLVQLRILKLSDNLLPAVPADLPYGLKHLGLSSNKIDTIGSDTFQDLREIEILRLNKNCNSASCCSDGPLSIDETAFSCLIHLTNLSLSHNRLTTIPPNLPVSLIELELHLNSIWQVNRSQLQNLRQLKLLDLSGNCPECSTAPFPCVPCPTTNGSMEIESDAFSDLSNLVELRLSGNSLRTLPCSWFKNLASLQYLYLSFNFLMTEIQTGEFLSVLPHIEVMDLSFSNHRKQYKKTIELSPNFSKLTSLKTLHMEGYIFRNLRGNELSPFYGLKHLSVLNLGTNFLESVNISLFGNFFNLSLISLAENKLAFSSLSLPEDEHGLGQDEEEDDRYGPTIHKDENNRLYPDSIKQQCHDYGQVVDLSNNNIFYINPNLFRGMENTTCLNLSANSIGDSFNGTEFKHFPNLKYLDLSRNKIYLSYNNAFSELGELEILDLSFNSHYFMVTGVTHNLAFLQNLNSLRVLNVSWNEISTLSYPEMNSSSLQELHFQRNRLDMLWKDDKRYYGLFKNLKNLTHLDISFNELKRIPNEVYSNFPKTLIHLSLSKNKLEVFEWQVLESLQLLEQLDLSKNKLDVVTDKLMKITTTLKLLNLRDNRIVQLPDGFLRGVETLHTLDLSFNQVPLINRSTFLLGTENYLKELSLEGNPFVCTCDLLDFILWVEFSDVAIPRLATGVTCNAPANLQYHGVLSFDTEACINNNIAFMLYLLSSSLIFCTVIAALTINSIYWDASYIFHYCRAKLRGYRYLGSKGNMFDAFVTYDTADPLVSDWVLNRLRVELEEGGETSRPICLEERDWTPGVPAIDNLSQSIRSSRKTVFVLTEAYVRSGTFKMAVYLAHQRLLEEDVDVIVLLLLEPVWRLSRFIRLRRRVCEQSVLEWPSNPSAEHWFWQRLRNAIRAENQAVFNQLYSSHFTNK